MKLRIMLMAAAVLFAALLSGCFRESHELKDGYYMAEAVDFDDRGWKEYVSIYVVSGKIVTAEYDAFNKSGLTKSWGIDYMRSMRMENGTYPNEYSRIYTVSLVNWQDPDEIDAVAGATRAHSNFIMLAKAAMQKSKSGDKQVALVELD